MAKRAGALSADALAQEARAARDAAQAAKPLHVRLGRVEERLQQAVAKQHSAQAALEQAKVRHDNAVAHTAAVQKELAEVGAEAVTKPPEDVVAEGLRGLLAALEGCSFLSGEDASASQLKVMAAMEACHKAVDTAAAADEVFQDMEEALLAGDTPTVGAPVRTDGVVQAGLLSAEELARHLQGRASQLSDVQLGALARSSMRPGPY